MYTLPSRDIVLLYYVQNVWEWGGWCGISLKYPYLYLYCGPRCYKSLRTVKSTTTVGNFSIQNCFFHNFVKKETISRYTSHREINMSVASVS